MNENDGDTAQKMIPPSDEQEHIRVTRLQVSGLYGSICATRIHDRVVALDGVFNAQVNHLILQRTTTRRARTALAIS